MSNSLYHTIHIQTNGIYYSKPIRINIHNSSRRQKYSRRGNNIYKDERKAKVWIKGIFHLLKKILRINLASFDKYNYFKKKKKKRSSVGSNRNDDCQYKYPCILKMSTKCPDTYFVDSVCLSSNNIIKRKLEY